MSHFILMLTRDDRTVGDAAQVYRRLRGGPLLHVGVKDIGLPFDELAELVAMIKADGRQALLEVVSGTRDAELTSLEAAARLQVDYALGGRQAHDAVRILRGRPIRYFPFAGHTVGHPTRLVGDATEIIEDARALAAIPGVHGLDLLAYRFAGDVPALARAVVRAVPVPVIAAGSIDSAMRIGAMQAAGVWGFTVGSALFDGLFPADTFGAQIASILDVAGVQP
ncbi:4-hydroxythreonine-4-phosphate dehydrogenase [Ramlibacter sp.]|uniref:4-hydroxythreonine-4-phosphate dehydrogenase n=1 Tax=Ramlibacter sp. TaxID=1917967 RepID=UPI0017BF3DE4|nr:4-hydroxythreonine-4-phosphate dehydrogenase [Ramlibacter sp.]MBA2673192.1 4-hydroxythreonine-4-phosphate dehydrogenase [Ramlibacter sp.]